MALGMLKDPIGETMELGGQLFGVVLKTANQVCDFALKMMDFACCILNDVFCRCWTCQRTP